MSTPANAIKDARLDMVNGMPEAAEARAAARQRALDAVDEALCALYNWMDAIDSDCSIYTEEVRVAAEAWRQSVRFKIEHDRCMAHMAAGDRV
jgi:hypothetical protein